MIYKNQTEKWSQDDRGQWWYEYGRMHPWGKRTRTRGIIKKCIVCNNDFLTTPQRTRRKKEFKNPGCYCSKSCVSKISWNTLGRSGSSHYSWKGGRNIIKNGYVEIYFPDHPFARGDKYVREHRLVMERYLGRYLQPYELVHHKNGVKDDNRIENLVLVSNDNHYGEIQCPHCQKTFLIK